MLAFAALTLISRTEFGRALEATREDRDAVALIGIDRDKVFSIGWGIGAAAVGVAGVMLASFYYISPTVGANFALIAYVTVALGGFGSLLGALIAGLLVGLVEALTALVMDPVAEAGRHFRDLRAGADVPATRPVRTTVSTAMPTTPSSGAGGAS